VQTASTGPLIVSANGRYLIKKNGEEFFWLADTAWELLHKLNREEAIYYLTDRSFKKFNVIQAVILAELDGLRQPNFQGDLPLYNLNPETPNESYFLHVDWVIRQAAELGLYMALLPTWGDKVNKKYNWAKGPVIFNQENAAKYGRWLGDRYRGCNTIIWILGGDRNPDAADIQIWNAMARGIASAYPPGQKALMTFHPQPFEGGSSSQWFHKEEWLDFNMLQTGHGRDTAVYASIIRDYGLMPVKPVLDGEPTYEAHGISFNHLENGYSTDLDVRKMAYWDVFAGAFGHTYGCHSVWQFYDGKSQGVNHPLYCWQEALHLSGAEQMKWLKKLMESRPMLNRVPDCSLIIDPNPEGPDYKMALRDLDNRYAMIYTPTGKPFKLNTHNFLGHQIKFSWFNPKDGTMTNPVFADRKPGLFFRPPNEDSDWVLVVDGVDE